MLFVVVDRRSSEALLPVRVFAHRERNGGFVNLILLAASLTGFLFCIPQYLSARSYTPLAVGLAILPFAASILVATQLIQKFLGPIDLKVRGLLGLVLVAGALGWLTQIAADTNYWTWVFPQIVVLGLGVGIAIAPFNVVILSSTAPQDTGITAGILQTTPTFGGSLGIALLLIPFSSGSGDETDTISTVFT